MGTKFGEHTLIITGNDLTYFGGYKHSREGQIFNQNALQKIEICLKCSKNTEITHTHVTFIPYGS